MKALVLITCMITSVSAAAIVTVKPSNGIIDPPPIAKYANGASTFEDSIVRNVSASMEEDEATTEPNFLDSDEFDPASPSAEAILQQYDRYYEMETGESAYPTGQTVDKGNIDPLVLGGEFGDLLHLTAGCHRGSCSIWAIVSKAVQTITIYVNGSPLGLANNRTSTGIAGYRTPNFDKHPDGRIYNRYSSSRYPGGDYKGLGNMPYAVFIRGGYAIHGTPAGNWKKLGHRASHGCIRVHPSTGKMFNQLVRQFGAADTWITVH